MPLAPVLSTNARLRELAPSLARGWIAGLFVVCLAAGCGSSPAVRSADLPAVRAVRPSSGVRTPELDQQLLVRAREYLGVPYRWAGADPSGFDCSGFTAFVYRDLGMELPRTTVEQSHSGEWVALDEVAPGDLLFFGPGRKNLDHVGIVVSQPGQPLVMIHASSSRGVTETVVGRSPYWLRILRLARRVLPRWEG